MTSQQEILKQYWGFDSFRPLQEEIICSILAGNDTLALLPTGGGKSICFQVPAMMQPGICVVVSPLIALMKDQVAQLKRRHIKAACLVAGMHRTEIEQVLNQCVYGDTKFLYVSPERIKSKTFIEHYKQMKVSFLAVDEAHCISQWGYDFRPPYLDIVQLRTYHPKVPVIALTATATKEVVDDIQARLQFRKGQVFTGTFVRPNLAYMVIREQDKQGRLLRIIRKVGGSGIVYVRSRRGAYEMAEYLKHCGIEAEAYHAGMSQKERDVKQEIWNKSHRCIMVATNAFGMGIDKPDVRMVVHYDIPGSLEEYYQEAGRAGRDGNKAFAVLLYETADKAKLDRHLEQSFPPLNYIRNVYRAICNYYQIPIGSGAGESFDFDFEAICRNYNLDPLLVFNSARFFEREGLLALPDRNETESQLMIPVSNEDLYRFQVESRKYGALIQVLLRTYGGLFTDFVPISESMLAKRCSVPESAITEALSQLDRLNYVCYKRKATKPQIVFLSPRIDTDRLYLSDNNYKSLKEVMLRRKNEMVRYIDSSETCRTQFLSSYFGETVEEHCGVCDVCLLSRSAPTDPATLEQGIKAHLAQVPLTIKELAEKLNMVDEKTMTGIVRNLLDEGTLSLTADFRLRLADNR